MRAHLEAIIKILNQDIKPAADDVFYHIGRAIGEAKLALIDLSIEEKQR